MSRPGQPPPPTRFGAPAIQPHRAPAPAGIAPPATRFGAPAIQLYRAPSPAGIAPPPTVFRIGVPPVAQAMPAPRFHPPVIQRASSAAKLLGIAGEVQQDTNLCWAAASVAVLKFLGKSTTVTQTNLAATYVAGANATFDPADVLKAHGAYDGDDTGFPEQKVRDCIDDGWPVLVMIKRGRERHYLLLKGYQDVGRNYEYRIYDTDVGSEDWRPKSRIASSIVGVAYTKV